MSRPATSTTPPASLAAASGGATTRWRYDAAGRLVTESLPDGRCVEHEYDAAGQLTASRAGDAPRRTPTTPPVAVPAASSRTARSRSTRGARRAGSPPWSAAPPRAPPSGSPCTSTHSASWPRSTACRSSGTPGSRRRAAAGRRHRGRAGGAPHRGRGRHRGLGLPRVARGTLGQRPVGPRHRRRTLCRRPRRCRWRKPWSSPDSSWLGARVYDQDTRGFLLSTDPLDSVVGSAWAANRYSYAGNDPLHALDPLGLSPVTDAELQAWSVEHAGWMEKNWEYVVGGVAVLVGGALIVTGVGGPLGMALVSAGVDTIVQKATTGDVNRGEVAVSGVIGGATAGLGAYTSSAVRTGVYDQPGPGRQRGRQRHHRGCREHRLLPGRQRPGQDLAGCHRRLRRRARQRRR